MSPKVIWFEPAGERDLELIGKIIACKMPVDRTGTLNKFNWKYDCIPQNFSDAKSWSECCFSRAEELWNIGKPITVFWSGGIDSSVTLISLLETMPSSGDLHVRYSQHSINEFPSFYETIKRISNPFLSSSVEYFNPNFLKQDHIFVSGECADPIFGTDSVKKYEDLMNDSWESILYFEELWSVPLEISDRYIISNLLEEHVEKSPIEIKTVFDIYWWISFCFKWTFLDRVIPISYFLNDGTDVHKNYSFFNTEDFQKWSLCNHDIKHQNSCLTYKQPAKDFIYKFTGDKKYQINKTKEPSILKLFTPEFRSSRFDSNDRPKLLLDDGRLWRREDIITEEVLASIQCNY